MLLAPIGKEGEPVRALAFAGGGFDTAMQLGVTHALLVSDATPPDVVIGASAGTVSAVALAEVLQVEDPTQRVRRFREIYEAYLDAPHLIRQAYRPDTYQVDTQLPLESLKLPVDHQSERAERDEAVAARAGLINFLNTLLGLGLRLGTIVRGVRRVLGIRAAAEIRQAPVRVLVMFVELFRTFTLIGQNLHRMTAIVMPLLRARFRSELREERGATAAELIFRSRVFSLLTRSFSFVVSLGLLAWTWLVVTGIAAVLVILLGFSIVGPLEAFRDVATPGRHIPILQHWRTLLPASLLVGMLIPVAVVYVTKPTWRTLCTSVWSLLTFVSIAVFWGAAMIVAVALPRAIVLRVMDGPDWAWGLTWYGGVYGWVAGLVVLLLVGLGVLVLISITRNPEEFWRKFLAQFGLDNSILDPYPLRHLLVSLFDRPYHGVNDMRRVVEIALKDEQTTQTGPRNEKILDGYASVDRKTPIHVEVTVADLATGEFKVLPGSWRVIDALNAALSAVPIFPPYPSDQQLEKDEKARRATGGSLYVDSANVANEPTRPLFSFLRHSGLVERKAAALHLYSVSPFPFLAEKLDADRKPDGSHKEYDSLVSIALRAWTLRRFRDATLERRMTELHTKAMAPGGTIFFPDGEDEKKPLVRSWCYSIEPKTPIYANERIARSSSGRETRAIIAEAVAEGCRASLQAMIQPAITELATPPDSERDPQTAVSCWAAVQRHLGGDSAPLSGSASESTGVTNRGPGLIEVCEHCALYRNHKQANENGDRRARMLEVAPVGVRQPPRWPRRGEPRPESKEPSRAVTVTQNVEAIKRRWDGQWPPQRGDAPADERPTVSMLFSGGVFRGVFQIGSLNALSDVSLVPDVVAGASVGTITAAMAARAFLSGTAQDPNERRAERSRLILQLSSVYLAIDRLVLTDRFADFIRGVTVRGAGAEFSLRDADRLFRRFDASWPGFFSREGRRVVAGIERLTYVSPFELLALLRALRLQEFGSAVGLAGKYFDEWLERVGIGQEILGAEPLIRLINEYVLKDFPGHEGKPPESIPFRAFSDKGLFFLATGTNLTEGCLEILGDDQLSDPDRERTLQGTLLASSAFPGVFRPRWSWEFEPTCNSHHQFIDGGTVDNLPLDAVAEFLLHAARAGLTPLRPKTPHLIFAASLEEQTGPVSPDRLREFRRSWPAVLGHAKRLRYNQKIDVFARTQENLRHIISARRGDQAPRPGDWMPLDLETVAVKPRWLCGTFAFHPMLGFSRARQARSIAHGCAATLLALGRLDGSRLEAWGADVKRVPSEAQVKAEYKPIANQKECRKKGLCYYRPLLLCPYSVQGQEADGVKACGRTREELAKIHDACGQPDTHVNGR